MSQDTKNELPIKEPLEEPAADWVPLWIWPAVVLLAGMVLFRYLPQLIEDSPPWIWMSAAFGPALCGILILGWWLTLSRATWVERLAGFFGMVAIAAVTIVCLDKTMQGPAVMVLTIPLGTAAFALGAIFCANVLSFQRTVIALLLATLGLGVSALFRSDGMWGNFALGLHWRWSQSSEDMLSRNDPSRRATESKEPVAADAFAHPEWPSFRGPNRDGRELGTKIATDWKATPPKQLWKIAVGPGWSSFVVAGNRLFTQEQRGAMETVVCYTADTGKEVWTRQLESRFDDPLGGPGPRATPTLADGSLYVSFATGPVMRINPATGEEVWKADLRPLARPEPPMWGFSSSPLVVDSAVIVHAGGKEDKGTIALDKETGKLKWSAPAGDHSYASPQLSTVLGKPYVLMLTNAGLDLLDPASGAVRLKYEWPFDGYRALQPQVVDADSILLPSAMGSGTRRIRVSQDGDKLAAEEIWTSRDLKPDFNDFVVHQGHAYGFDGSNAVFTCIDLSTGSRSWKGGRYGKGQVLLLEDSAAILVAGEQGELVLLKADPTEHVELASIQAIEGKTWNHPVVVGDKLYIRNSQEAACYQLPLAP